ncbi:iron complex outermembrane receptor protein [Filimonas zeae]|uniref:TonB-dependent receptor n=1 Tax=Filimonas zeae TaxID=1737353 RepID=A0A917IXP5_9BACT|nr:TonB-dependent receptor [Filimonas zeae]MDR6338652.1 iron complex outermembrane receptor protein [Filimonas zeae]GGH67211.1 TonB-dependent receptor [Filimonas zeae]
MNFSTRLLAALFSMLFPLLLSAHPPAKGVITGKILTSDGKPAEYATVVLDGKRTIRVDKDGVFRIENLEAGKYVVTVSYAGQEPQQKTIDLASGETVAADFALSVSATALNEVVIIGNKYAVTARKKSSTAARMPLNYLENPQSYSVVGKELIGEQMALTLEEAFRNVPGAVPAKTGAGMPAFASRGFYNTENFRNGMATYLRTGIDLALVDRVEAIKGPSATLFGGKMASFGGLINYVTKKPYQQLGGEVSYSTGSFELNRLTADINTPVNDDKTLLFRINLAGQNKNDFQDQGHGSSLVAAPSLTYQPNDRLTLRLDADIQTYKGTNNNAWTVATTGPTVKSMDEFAIDFKRSLIDNSFISRQTSRNFYVSAEYKLSDSWTSQTNYANGGGEYNNLYYFNQTWLTDSTVNRRVDVFSPDKTGRTQIQQNFTGDFHLGKFRNRLLVGLDYVSEYRSYKYVGMPGGVVNIKAASIPDIKLESVQRRFADTSAGAPLHLRQKNYAAYVSDVFNITEALNIMASVRLDKLENGGSTNDLTRVTSGKYSQTSLSPKLGLVYQVVKEKVSVFGNYMSGFSNQAPVNNDNGTVADSKPKYGNQWESGIKLDLFKNKISSTISYYEIRVENAQRLEMQGTQRFYYFDGTQKSKGVEAEIIGNPFPGFNFVSGYGFNENTYIKANAELVGKTAIGAPKHVGNFWGSYTLLNGKLKGLGFGAGFIYASEAWVNGANTVTMPAYTVADASIFYNTPQFRIGFKANNLTNSKYWVSDGFLSHYQPTVNYLATVAYKF